MLYILSDSSSTGTAASLIVWIVILVVFMFIFMIRPSRKEEKKKQEMLSGLEAGDTVMTSSGFYGVVIDIQDDTVIVEFGSNRNCRIPMRKDAIVQIEKPGEAEE